MDLDTKVNPIKKVAKETTIKLKEVTIKKEILEAEDHHLEGYLRAEDLSDVIIVIKKAT